ncbi:unnamed protein product [Orchesella dallaii]|uniref:Uncharacterized protein n=1 Tax=Orchesella dallaii TaxID=48710 RepID=A0ABP1S163_9HEXA
MKPCDRSTRSPQMEEDAINISRHDAAFTKKVIEGVYGLSHKSRAKTSIGRFWRGRKFHGIVCLIFTLFLMPVSYFMVRCYKETFMDSSSKGFISGIGVMLAAPSLLSEFFCPDRLQWARPWKVGVQVKGFMPFGIIHWDGFLSFFTF